MASEIISPRDILFIQKSLHKQPNSTSFLEGYHAPQYSQAYHAPQYDEKYEICYTMHLGVTQTTLDYLYSDRAPTVEELIDMFVDTPDAWFCSRGIWIRLRKREISSSPTVSIKFCPQNYPDQYVERIIPKTK